MYMLDSKGPINTDHVFYFVKPQVSKIELLVKNFNEQEAKKRHYHLVYIPEQSLTCERVLREKNVDGYFKSVDEFPLYFYPFDCDLLSMEDELAFKESTVNGDRTSIYNAACGLMELQILYGVIPTILGQGKNAKTLCDILLRKRKELEHRCSKQVSQIDTLIIVDRSIDLVSPLITQLTYEGLIDEIYGIRNNNVKLPSAKFNQQQKDSKENAPINISTDQKQFTLNSSEELFCKLRDKNFNAIPIFLTSKSKSLRVEYEERHALKSVTDYKSFVDKLPYLQNTRKSLANHLLIAELITEVTSSAAFREKLGVEQSFIDLIDTDKINAYIEDCICRREPITKILRLICLQSQVNNGLKGKTLDYYKREIVQTYGFYHLLNIENLTRSGALRTGPCYARGFANVRKSMRLTVDNSNEKNPTDICYVYSYFAPLSVRLCQYLVNPGWKMINDTIIKQLPEPFFEVVQPVDSSLRRRRNSGASVASNFSTDEPKTVLVFFLGGCTYAEISALRFLSAQDDVNAEFVVATTKIINGNSFVESLFEIKV